jgi:hypothetical protein
MTLDLKQARAPVSRAFRGAAFPKPLIPAPSWK